MAQLSELIDTRLLGDEVDEEDDDSGFMEVEEDLFEALSLLQQCLDELEDVERQDKTRKFLTTRRRKVIGDLTIDVMTFLGQWEFNSGGTP